MGADVDIEASGLLDGLEGRARRDRAELVAWLIEQGFDIEHVRGSVGAPLLLPVNRVLGDDGEYVSAQQVCESTGIDLDLLQRLQGAVGLPRTDDPNAAVLLRSDAEAAAHAKLFIDEGVDPDETVALMRALMEGLGQAAAMMRLAAFKILMRPGASEIELAQASEELIRKTEPRLGPMIEDLLRLRLRQSLEVEAVNAAERAAGALPGARQVSVAFADVAGFTRLGETVPAEELHRLASRLVDLAYTLAVVPVRFIKAIGDEVMLVSTDPGPLLHTVLDLEAAARANGLPRLRIGVASGAAVTRGGDWFGRPVNVASRVTSAARPGSVLVAESTHDLVGSVAGLTWTPAGNRRLKGLRDEIKLFRLARSAEPQEV